MWKCSLETQVPTHRHLTTLIIMGHWVWGPFVATNYSFRKELKSAVQVSVCQVTLWPLVPDRESLMRLLDSVKWKPRKYTTGDSAMESNQTTTPINITTTTRLNNPLAFIMGLDWSPIFMTNYDPIQRFLPAAEFFQSSRGLQYRTCSLKWTWCLQHNALACVYECPITNQMPHPESSHHIQYNVFCWSSFILPEVIKW